MSTELALKGCAWCGTIPTHFVTEHKGCPPSHHYQCDNQNCGVIARTPDCGSQRDAAGLWNRRSVNSADDRAEQRRRMVELVKWWRERLQTTIDACDGMGTLRASAYKTCADELEALITGEATHEQ